MRRWCRDHLDTDEEEYPNTLLDSYLNDAYERTMTIEQFWPRFRHRWPLTVGADEATVLLPVNCDTAAITDVVDITGGARRPLLNIDGFEFEDHGGNPLYGQRGYRIFGDTLEFWPPGASYASGREYELLGYRYHDPFPTDPLGEPDCDPRLHMAICYYAVSLMYLNQEDEVLSGIYVQRWEQASQMAARAIMRRSNQHVVMNRMLGVY